MHSWDRQSFDTDETFRWYQAYRDAVPPRQLGRLRVPGHVTPPLQVLLGWYNDGAWRDRAAAWDAHLDQIRQGEREQFARQQAGDVNARHRALAHELLELVEREVDKFLRTSMSSEAEVLRPQELNRMIENAIKLGRLLQGESTESVEQRAAVDISGLDDEDLRTLRRLKEKAEGRGGE